jgi:WhiB family redox-sensing transcriptional regulator
VTVSERLGASPSTAAGTAWRVDASCRFADPDLFFPAGSTGDAIDETEAAKAVCRACRVQGICLQFAIETNQEHGIWGGTTQDERRRLRRQRLARRRRIGG